MLKGSDILSGTPKSVKRKCVKIVSDRAEKREGTKWDLHPLGKLQNPAAQLRYGVHLDMKNGHGRNETAEKHGVSVGFVTKWHKILSAAETAGFSIRAVCKALPTRPEHRTPVQDEFADTVLALKRKYPSAGPKMLKEIGRLRISVSTVRKILKKHGLVSRRKPYRKRSYVRFERPYSMYSLQTDFKTWGEGVFSIWILDDHSRAILGYRVEPFEHTDTVIELLTEVFAKYGKPLEIHTDHGTQFTSMAKGSVHKFEEWLKEQGVGHVMGRVGHPQSQGKIERTHGTAATELPRFGPMDTVENARITIGKWIEFYNWERPHTSLKMQTPMTVFYRDIRPEWGPCPRPDWMSVFDLPA